MVFILALCVALIIFVLFMMLRNSWVFNTRMRWIGEDVESFDRAVDYGTMMLRWWNWDSKVTSWRKQ